jgi:hypothetical protein
MERILGSECFYHLQWPVSAITFTSKDILSGHMPFAPNDMQKFLHPRGNRDRPGRLVLSSGVIAVSSLWTCVRCSVPPVLCTELEKCSGARIRHLGGLVFALGLSEGVRSMTGLLKSFGSRRLCQRYFDFLQLSQDWKIRPRRLSALF